MDDTIGIVSVFGSITMLCGGRCPPIFCAHVDRSKRDAVSRRVSYFRQSYSEEFKFKILGSRESLGLERES